MARRSKAASRSARQRRRGRPPRRPIPPAPRPAGAPTAAPLAPTPSAAPIAEVPAGRGSRFDPRSVVAGPSALGEQGRAEYGYVLRELRSIGVLVVLMALVLAAAWFAFRALGIGPA